MLCEAVECAVRACISLIGPCGGSLGTGHSDVDVADVEAWRSSGSWTRPLIVTIWFSFFVIPLD